MVGKSLERHVEEAEQATGHVVREQGRRVSDAVPVRTQSEAQRLDASTQAAVESTRLLDRNSESFRRLQALFIRARLENLYRSADEGHDRPPTVFRDSAEAERTHSGSIIAEARKTIETEAAESGTAPVLPAQERSDEDLAQAQSTLDGYSRRISNEWLTREFLGDRLYERYTQTPPVVTAEDESYFETLAAAYGGFRVGMYFGGTNHIICGAYQAEWEEANLLHLLTHEQLHYASYLGGGQSVRWRDDSGGPVMQLGGFWHINEGMTELLTQHLMRDNGYDLPTVAYPYESAICFVLEQVVGAEPLKQAYLSGDYTQVRRLLDARLGQGMFDTLMATQVNAEAYSLIMQRAGAAGYDTASWESNPIMGRCFRQIADMMAR